MIIELVDELERGLAYAESCFETFRLIDGQVFALEQHASRLQQSASAFAWSVDGMELCQQALAAAVTSGDDLLRLTLSAGLSPWGLLPPAEAKINRRLQCMPTPQRQPLLLRTVAADALPPRPRQGKFASDYADGLRLYHRQRGLLAHGESPLWYVDDGLISTMTANVLLYVNGRWLTPKNERILPGIVRQALLDAGVLESQRCSCDMIDQVEAAACCNSGVLIQPVVRINQRLLRCDDAVFEPLRCALRDQPGVAF